MTKLLVTARESSISTSVAPTMFVGVLIALENPTAEMSVATGRVISTNSFAPPAADWYRSPAVSSTSLTRYEQTYTPETEEDEHCVPSAIFRFCVSNTCSSLSVMAAAPAMTRT